MGISKPLTDEEAAWMLARLIASGISEGRVKPYEGANFIWRDLVNQIWPNEQHPLLPFVAWASDYGDCESYSDRPDNRRREIEEEIVKEARLLVSSE